MKKTVTIILIVFVAIINIAAVYVGLFGIDLWKGDTRTVHIKGLLDIKRETKYTEIKLKSTAVASDEDMEKVKSIVEDRIEGCGIKIYSIKIEEQNIICIRCFTGSETTFEQLEKTVDSLCQKGELTFCKASYYDENNILFTGEHVEKATANYYEDYSWHVSIYLDSSATSIFATATEELVSTNGQIAICMDGVTITAPRVEAVISNGEAIITGMADQYEAKKIASIINSGSLPFDLELYSMSTVN